MNRGRFPVAVGMGATNLLMVSGYLLVLNAVAGLDGRRHAGSSVGALCLLALAWAVAGPSFPVAFWNHLSALPIALACALTAGILLRSPAARDLRSRSLAVAIAGVHAAFYLGRAFVAPVLVAWFGPEILLAVAKATMYEAVLYSVAMPMSVLALVREEERRHLLRLSHTDPLTGLANRHAFFEEGARILGAARGRPVALLAFDLDHFKAINDRHGHPAGDRILTLFAEAARDGAGSDALLVRLGGEEFAALLPGCDLPEALGRGAAIAGRLAARSAELGIPATVSIGLSAPDRRDLAGMLASADAALYRAKRLGRNRIEIADPQSLSNAA